MYTVLVFSEYKFPPREFQMVLLCVLVSRELECCGERQVFSLCGQAAKKGRDAESRFLGE